MHLDIATDAGDMTGHLFTPESGRGPGLGLLQEIFGVSDYIIARATDLASLGYTVLVPEIYHRLGVVKVDERADDMLEQAMGLVGRLDWAAAVADARSAIATLRTHDSCDGRVGAIGFCFGGGLAYATAAGAVPPEGPDCLVSYYGSALPSLVDNVPIVQVPSLHHFGTADAYIPTGVQEHILDVVMEGPDVEWYTWEGANHAFDNTSPMFHHAEASAAAWEVTTEWLADHLPSDGDGTVPA